MTIHQNINQLPKFPGLWKLDMNTRAPIQIRGAYFIPSFAVDIQISAMSSNYQHHGNFFQNNRRVGESIDTSRQWSYKDKFGIKGGDHRIRPSDIVTDPLAGVQT